MLLRSLIFSCLLLVAISVSAQEKDSLKQTTDTGYHHSPRKAAILSAVIPGGGQVYNGKIWKVPIIYAGFGALAYSITFNQGEYKRYKEAYIASIDKDPNTVPGFFGTPDNLKSRRNYYKKYRDLSIIGAVALYALQIIDANVDGHLKYFDVSDDLTLRFNPVYEKSPSGFGSLQLMTFQVKF